MIQLPLVKNDPATTMKMSYPEIIGRERLGERLKWARDRARITQADLAISVGVSQQAIAKIEDGQTKDPRRRLIMAMAEKLDVSPGWLAFGREEIDALDAESLEVARMWSLLPADQKEAHKLLIKRELENKNTPLK